MGELVISQVEQGVAQARSTDPFGTLVVHRLERSKWAKAPQVPGVYLLYGVTGESKLTVYIGMSQSNIRARVASHHVTPAKNWFGTLFAIPVPDRLLVPAVEAELIALLDEGAAEVIDNVRTESHHLGSSDVHVEPAVEAIRSALELMLGADIFSAAGAPDGADADANVQIDAVKPKAKANARDYVFGAAAVRGRTDADPDSARHWFVGPEVGAWGRFEGDEPDRRFRVLAGSRWRRAVANPEHTAYRQEQGVVDLQDALVEDGVLDDTSMTFTRDHVFDTWRPATLIVAGKPSYTGSYHWQRLSGPTDCQ